MSEVASRDTFRSRLLEAFPGMHIQRFEDKFASGIPDINLCYHGREWWVEAKFINEFPKRETTPVSISFRPGQIKWLTDRTKAGGKCLILLRVGTGYWLAFDNHFQMVEDGVPKDSLLQLAKWHGARLDVVSIFKQPILTHSLPS